MFLWIPLNLAFMSQFLTLASRVYSLLAYLLEMADVTMAVLPYQLVTLYTSLYPTISSSCICLEVAAKKQGEKKSAGCTNSSLCVLAAHVHTQLWKPGTICAKLYFYPEWSAPLVPIPSPGWWMSVAHKVRLSHLNIELLCSTQVHFAPSAEKHSEMWSVSGRSGSESGQFWFCLALRTLSSGIQMKRLLIKECQSDFPHFDEDWWAGQAFASPPAACCLCTPVYTAAEGKCLLVEISKLSSRNYGLLSHPWLLCPLERQDCKSHLCSSQHLQGLSLRAILTRAE